MRIASQKPATLSSHTSSNIICLCMSGQGICRTAAVALCKTVENRSLRTK